jgi:hypothetical protein
MKNLIAISALIITTGCTILPEHQPLARIATINATNNLINNGYSAQELANIKLENKLVTVDKVGLEIDGIVGETLQDKMNYISERSRTGYHIKMPGRMFKNDVIDLNLIESWMSEAAAKRI